MRFEVVIPTHDPHLQCFREVAESVVWALRELGHDVSLVLGSPLGSGRAIYFGLPLGPLPPDAILYNGEQVGPASLWTARRLDLIYRNHVVWDYSPVNAMRYSDYGLPRPPVVQPGHCPALERRIPRKDKTHDVVFFGSHNERRARILQQLEEAGIKLLRVPFGLYGAERDAFIARARLCLNIHFYEKAIFESVRCSHLIHNNVPIVSEIDAENSYRKWGVHGAEYEGLVGSVQRLLDRNLALDGLAALQYHDLLQIPIKDDVEAALDRLGEKRVISDVAVTVRPAPALPDLTLCMIVKDEAPVIERCLASVKPFLKRWCIVDTGSTDGTQEIIRKFMDNIPGTLHERPWKEYDGSRTEVTDLARAECQEQGWLLLIDADEIFSLEGDFVLPDSDRFDCYNAWITRCLGCQKWGRTALLRANKPWFYQLPRHEGVYCRSFAPSHPVPLPNIKILSTHDGSRAKRDAYERFMEDAHVLEKWLEANPNHPIRTRCVYYIAQSYRDAATGKTPFDRDAMQKALTHYLRRSVMGGYDQEVHSTLLWAAYCMTKLDYPWDTIQRELLKAYAQRPSRAEALYQIGEHYRIAGQYPVAEMFLRTAAAIPPTTDRLPDVDLPVYTWKAKEELAVALTWLDKWDEAKRLFREVLKVSELPAHERMRIDGHLKDCIKNAPD